MFLRGIQYWYPRQKHLLLKFMVSIYKFLSVFEDSSSSLSLPLYVYVLMPLLPPPPPATQKFSVESYDVMPRCCNLSFTRQQKWIKNVSSCFAFRQHGFIYCLLMLCPYLLSPLQIYTVTAIAVYLTETWRTLAPALKLRIIMRNYFDPSWNALWCAQYGVRGKLRVL